AFGASVVPGVRVACGGLPFALKDGSATTTASTTKAAMSTPTTPWSRRVNSDGPSSDAGSAPPAEAASAPGGPGASGSRCRREDEAGQREEHEQRDEDDRELPEAPFDPPAAAVHGRIAAERAG